jgi:hypothetical protein
VARDSSIFDRQSSCPLFGPCFFPFASRTDCLNILMCHVIDLQMGILCMMHQNFGL